MSISIEAHDRICQDLHQQMRSLIVENERLKAAAQQALEALEQSAPCHNPLGTVRQDMDSAITALRAALAEPVQQGCDHCNHPLYAAVKCRVCGRVTEPAQEPNQP